MKKQLSSSLFLISLSVTIAMSTAAAFAVHSDAQRRWKTTATATNKNHPLRPLAPLVLASSASETQDPLSAQQQPESQQAQTDQESIVDISTLTLLEHVNLNVPDHQFILPFYYDILGLGMDPRKAANLQPDSPKRTLWANAGASQFHLPHGDPAQRIPGHVGLQYKDDRSLQALRRRLDAHPDAYQSYEAVYQNNKGDTLPVLEALIIIDQYGNEFRCRAQSSRVPVTWQQPIIGTTEADVEAWGSDVVQRFGRQTNHAVADRGGGTDGTCLGLSYVEFHCPVGTAAKIAQFYESVLDATTSVIPVPPPPPSSSDNTATAATVPPTWIAIIAVGRVTAQGVPDQSLIFRETSNDALLPPYDGHHVALYVGRSGADFDQAFANAQLAGVVWVNPRFSDKADTLEGAQQWQQFRFKNIVDMETGEVLMELEHEIRSVQHDAFPGQGQPLSSYV